MFIKKYLQRDPKIQFTKAREAFDRGQYEKASKMYENVYLKLETLEMRVISLENAAIAAEFAERYEHSQWLYLQLILYKLVNGYKTTKEILGDLDKAIQLTRFIQKSGISVNKLNYMKFLIFLSEKQFDKVSNFYEQIKSNPADKYSKAIDEAWNLIYSYETFEEQDHLPQLDLPVEFESIFREAEKVMQRCSLCEIHLSVDENQTLEKGSKFELACKLTAHAQISIHDIKLKTGTRGRTISNTLPDLPLKMSTGENYSIIYILIPNLPGSWELGPLSVTYNVLSEDGEYPTGSKPIGIDVKEASPEFKIIMEPETIEEDLDYIIRITAENIGKTVLQDVKIVIDTPETVKITEGTNEKYLSTLVEGEKFSYEIRIQFALDKTHFEGNIIRVNGYIGENIRLAKTSLKIGGKN